MVGGDTLCFFFVFTKYPSVVAICNSQFFKFHVVLPQVFFFFEVVAAHNSTTLSAHINPLCYVKCFLFECPALCTPSLFCYIMNYYCVFFSLVCASTEYLLLNVNNMFSNKYLLANFCPYKPHFHKKCFFRMLYVTIVLLLLVTLSSDNPHCERGTELYPSHYISIFFSTSSAFEVHLFGGCNRLIYLFL